MPPSPEPGVPAGATICMVDTSILIEFKTLATFVRVLTVAEQLVDLEATHEREVADPYVAAKALEIVERDLSRVVVATNDRVDRLPAKLSLITACRRLDLECWGPEEFLVWISATT